MGLCISSSGPFSGYNCFHSYLGPSDMWVAMAAAVLVLHLGRPSVNLEGRDGEDCAALACHIDAALRERFVTTVREDPGQAMLIADSCDGTPW